MRNKLALGAALALTVFVYCALKALAEYLDMPFWRDGSGDIVSYGSGRQAYESEDSGGWVGLGLYALLSSPMLGWRLYRWVACGKPDGGLDVEQRAKWWGWFCAASLYAVGLIFLHWIDPWPRISGALELALMGVCGYAGIRIFWHRLKT